MNPGSPRRAVCIVVPIYGARRSLLRCIEALIETVDQGIDSVLLVNDGGPEADAVESDVRAAIVGQRAFHYERNQRNLGFVGACNRAAIELAPSGTDILLLNSDTVPTAGWVEEMVDVLNLSPQNGIVCPRSDNATIASLPFRLRDVTTARSRTRTLEVHAALHERLPRWSAVPVAMGFCFLVRRELINKFGLFDQLFAPGYGEENDFCLRMRKEGYHSVMAHRALVFHEAAQSFPPPQRVKLRARHERLLHHRHPDYPLLLHRYLHAEADAVDVFADALVPADDSPRIIIASDGREPLHIPDRGDLLITVMGSNQYGSHDSVPAALSNRIWDVAIAVGDLTPAEAAILAGNAPRVMAVPVLTPLVVDSAVDLATQPIDDGDLRAHWRDASAARAQAGLLSPPSADVKTRLLALLERNVPRVATRLRQLRSKQYRR